ncbi:hypothetical protein E4U13_005192 [Claviceps humidiphila]|uniref:ubiquitinyl hydrolase 1 n=1 Tax=Claviceps humidiphila TaxID=1294629 RepID=A0A9P7PXU1_9HYPO|nr:hypothetical protein E4U13_005192 [Claviceps humidiphila]
MKEFPRKFLNLREKHVNHIRSKSVPPEQREKARPLSAETFRAMFKKDGSKNALKSDAELESDQAKIERVQRRLETADVSNITVDYIKELMSSNICEGDVDKTVDFIVLERKAASGFIEPYNPMMHMQGAENRGNVTCYLDALLFAMFSKLDAFECMLKSDFPVEDPRHKLGTLLRIWVSSLRSGHLIRTDFMKLIQDTLGDCGWAEARLLEQQDTSEAFAFLTETLQLPLLSLQVDLFHQGMKDKEDHKVVYERLLNLAVPPDPEGKGIKLEDCLEEYFNARVDVLRDHEEGKKGSIDDRGAADVSSCASQSTIRFIRADEGAKSSTAASPSEHTPSQLSDGESFDGNFLEPYGLKNTEHTNALAAPPGANKFVNMPGATMRPNARHRSTSLIQRMVLDGHGRPRGTEDSAMAKRTKREGSTVVKAVTIPAWQFFRLIPWHALTPNEPRSDSEVALNFDQRPVVGICLKRYVMTESGQPQRCNTFIDIPDCLRLPQFMLSGGPEEDEELNGLSTEYKLVLQSVVCHRGDSLQSGHYIAFARVAPKLLTGNRRHNFDPPPDYEEPQWVKFDDLETENRVTYVEDIKLALRSEMPYLLFYQIVPMVDMVRCSMDGQDLEPPSYNESKHSLDSNFIHFSPSAFHLDTSPLHGDFLQGPSIRLSAELESSARGSTWSTSHTSSTPIDSSRESVANTDSPVITPEASSPVIAPADGPNEPTPSRLSRATSRFTLGRPSRPPSLSGEGRISFSMARLGGFMKPSKEPLAESTSANASQASASATMSTGGPRDASDSFDITPESPVEGDKQNTTPPPVKEKEKQHKYRGKTKEKAEKQKSGPGEQPERECMLM